MEDDWVKLRQEITTLSELIARYEPTVKDPDKDLIHNKNLLRWKKSLLILIESELGESCNPKQKFPR